MYDQNEWIEIMWNWKRHSEPHTFKCDGSSHNSWLSHMNGLKISLWAGPFRATQIWNELIGHMKSKVELKRRRYKMRHYDNCFTGTDAVDVILHYLLSDKETFSTDLTREKAVKVKSVLFSFHFFAFLCLCEKCLQSFHDVKKWKIFWKCQSLPGCTCSNLKLYGQCRNIASTEIIV